MTSFEKFDFNRSDCISLSQSQKKTGSMSLTRFHLIRTPQIISQLLYIEKHISSSYLKEKIHEDHVAFSKIKVDPKYFFRYAK